MRRPNHIEHAVCQTKVLSYLQRTTHAVFNTVQDDSPNTRTILSGFQSKSLLCFVDSLPNAL